MSPDSQYHDPNSKATDPGGIILSYSRLWKLDPAGRGIAGIPWAMTRGAKRLEEHLLLGDSRAAVVVSADPLLVAAYSDEIDGVVMLHFPQRLVNEFNLCEGSRLLTVNTYSDGNKVVDDLIEGDKSYRRTANMYAVIADFVTDNNERLNEAKIPPFP